MERTSDSVMFGVLDAKTGEMIETRYIKNEDIRRCPSFILVAEHYDADGNCRCSNPVCDFTDCTDKKYNGEIYCRTHLLEIDPNYEDE